MNIIEQLQSLDTNDIGRWPLFFRAVLIAIIFVAVSVGGSYYFVYRTKALLLEQAEAKEIELKATFVAKQKRAANLDAYKVQLKEMEVSFGAMLRQLPSRTEVPSLLVDISQTGLAAGLEERLFQPSSEIKKDFYAELPIKIRLQGSYHDLAQFVSGIAALPRIVTLHDVLIQPEKNTGGNDLMLDVTAKTYRYLEEES
ncbi:MAG: type 4a pilus biogenesis protein PilO [Gammaproteobacteria bacterium]|nr:type 4a pilus biogenesis protein PilO [Gammaproteobacteria bacterium]MCZ6880241.1 type 4a pilus biogenesis protein PilO [Gammaproteobacteria bacterium]